MSILNIVMDGYHRSIGSPDGWRSEVQRAVGGYKFCIQWKLVEGRVIVSALSVPGENDHTLRWPAILTLRVFILHQGARDIVMGNGIEFTMNKPSAPVEHEKPILAYNKSNLDKAVKDDALWFIVSDLDVQPCEK